MLFATGWQAYSFWLSEQGAADGSLEAATMGEQRSTRQEPEISLASVSMFGDAEQVESTPSENIDNLPETNLKLVLRGVMSASGEFPGSALVEDSKRQTEAYIVGDELPGNATLRTVRPDRIIIERAGALENLYFPEDEDRTGIDLASNNGPDSNTTPASFPGPATNQSSDARREEIRQRLEQLRNRLRNNN
jgi:general secretion pathway protein C